MGRYMVWQGKKKGRLRFLAHWIICKIYIWERKRSREKQMVVENGPCSRKFLPSVEKTEHLLWSTPWIHTPDNRNEGQLQGDCVPSPPGCAS